MNRLIILIVSAVWCVTDCFAMSAPHMSEIDKIKANYRAILLPENSENDSLLRDLMKIPPETEMSDQVVIELHQRYPFDLAKVEKYLSLLQPDGSWSDINYKDTKRSGWEPKQHADRVLEMVKIYKNPATSGCDLSRLRDNIHSALNYWFTAKPKCLNWWQNEIGVPKTLGQACILIEDELTPEELQGIEEVLSAARFKMTGQNKVWLAGNVLMRGLMQNDEALVKMARDTIASEICVGRPEGIKSDWSFHQHGPQQQFGNYGLAYLSSMGFYHQLFDNTALKFDEQKEQVLRSFINEGYKWVIWNRYMDVSALGRQLFHNAQLHKGYALAFTGADFGIGGFPKNGNLLVGHKHFDESDYTIHRTPKWMASLKMSSSRVIGTEVVNEDNLLGYYLGDGATYYYVRGDEYDNVFPFWDWRKIPGVTAYEDTAPIPNIRKNKSRNKSPLVGGTTYGNNGVSVMALERDGLSARKAWVFTDDFVLCLGGGICADSLLNVTTSIDARIKHGHLSVYDDANNRWENLNGGKSFKSDMVKIHHDNIGYVVVSPDSLSAYGGEKSGRWNDFMKMYRPGTVDGEVVTLHLNHGVAPKNCSYQYFVMPACDRDSIQQFDPEKKVRVVRNDSSAQILEILGDNPELWAIFYECGNTDIDGMNFTPEKPGIYLLEKNNGKLQPKVRYDFKI